MHQGKHSSSYVFSKIWHANIPPSYSPLVWRIIGKYIAFDSLLWAKDFLYLLNVNVVIIEDINHIFVNDPIVVKTRT